MTATGPFYNNHDKTAPDLGEAVLPCRREDPEMWFAESSNRSLTPEQKEAKRLCGTCPAQAACLVQASLNDEQWGIWGGLTPYERGADQKRRRAAA